MTHVNALFNRCLPTFLRDIGPWDSTVIIAINALRASPEAFVAISPVCRWICAGLNRLLSSVSHFHALTSWSISMELRAMRGVAAEGAKLGAADKPVKGLKIPLLFLYQVVPGVPVARKAKTKQRESPTRVR